MAKSSNVSAIKFWVKLGKSATEKLEKSFVRLLENIL
jgi:hypothetical protein